MKLYKLQEPTIFTAYDTTYLLTAMHEGLPMTINDKALIKACHNNGIPL